MRAILFALVFLAVQPLAAQRQEPFELVVAGTYWPDVGFTFPIRHNLHWIHPNRIEFDTDIAFACRSATEGSWPCDRPSSMRLSLASSQARITIPRGRFQS